MNRRRSLMLGASLLLLFATLGSSADDSSTLSKLNPFSSSTSKKPKVRGNGVAAAQPSTWDKVKSGTKSALNKTNQTLNPWAKKPAAPSPYPDPKQAANWPKKQEKKSWLSGLGSKSDESSKPKTVNEWLAQPRPQ